MITEGGGGTGGDDGANSAHLGAELHPDMEGDPSHWTTVDNPSCKRHICTQMLAVVMWRVGSTPSDLTCCCTSHNRRCDCVICVSECDVPAEPGSLRVNSARFLYPSDV